MTLDGAMPLALAAVLCAAGATGANTALAAMTGSDVDTEAECRWCHCAQPGESPLYMPNRHHSKVGRPIPGPTSETYTCLTAACHRMTWNPVTSAYEFENFRDCIACHGSSPVPGHHLLARDVSTDHACAQCHAVSEDPSTGCRTMNLVSWCGRLPSASADPSVAAEPTR
jgi:hypothetical protein